MTRDYGRVSIKFWNSADIRSLSDQGKLLASYLITGPHSNIIGAYLLPDAYVADDLGWTATTVSKVFAELFRNGFAVRFKDGRHICVCKFLEHNKIENPNVAKAAIKQFEQLPYDPALKHVLNGLELYEKQFPNGLERVRERLGKPFRNMEPNRTDTEPEPEPKPIGTSADADASALALEAYNLEAEKHDWPEAQRMTPKRRTAFRARLSECGGVDGWRQAMQRAGQSDFLTGRTRRSDGHEKWSPSLDFFLKQDSFTKLMEGSYDNHGTLEFGGSIRGAARQALDEIERAKARRAGEAAGPSGGDGDEPDARGPSRTRQAGNGCGDHHATGDAGRGLSLATQEPGRSSDEIPGFLLRSARVS